METAHRPAAIMLLLKRWLFQTSLCQTPLRQLMSPRIASWCHPTLPHCCHRKYALLAVRTFCWKVADLMRVVGVKKGFIITCGDTHLVSTQHR